MAEFGVAALALALVGAAVAVGAWMNGRGEPLYAGAAPLFGQWLPRVGPGTPVAITIAVVVIALGPGLAARLTWPRLLAAGYAAAVAWTGALAMVDGWQRGLAQRVEHGGRIARHRLAARLRPLELRHQTTAFEQRDDVRPRMDQKNETFVPHVLAIVAGPRAPRKVRVRIGKLATRKDTVPEDERLKVIESRLPVPWGLSLVAHGRRPG